MVTGPRETPHPIILHVDDQGNPVRLAEASAIYVTTVSALNISATNYLGLSLTGVAVPQGTGTEIQFRRNSTQLGGDSSLTFDEGNQRLRAAEIVVGDLSSTNTIYSEETITARLSVSSPSISSIDFKTQTLSATTISAVTVCATNYNSLFDSLNFQNLDARYLNSSGDSVTGSFTVQSLSATTISATNWRGLPSALATWNASSIQGIPVTSTPPSPLQTLIYKDGVWQPSSVAGVAGGIPGGSPLTIQFNNGIFSGVDSVKYSESISGLSLTTLSSTNLSSVNIRVTTISATTYENNGSGLPTWNAQKIQDVPVSKSGGLVYKDILAIDSGGTRFEKTGIDDYASWVYTSIKPTIHNELPQTNASALRGFTVTSTTPSANNVLIYTGSTWAPSSAISLNTISATNWRGLPSSLAIWNASAVRGVEVLSVDNAVTGNVLGAFVYSRQTNQYYTLPFSSTAIAGTRTYGDIGKQGQVVASYLGSATPSLQINPVFASINDFPENNDVLVFSSALYADGLGGPGWTWAQPSSLVPTVTPFGSTGEIQFKGPNGQFSSIPGLLYGSDNNYLGAPNIYIPDGGTIDTPFIYSRGGGYIAAAISIVNVSAGVYNIFGKETSSAATVTPPSNNNQNIVYDLTAQKWKPGYAIYQATSTPAPGFGSNGDVYFQYLP